MLKIIVLLNIFVETVKDFSRPQTGNVYIYILKKKLKSERGQRSLFHWN